MLNIKKIIAQHDFTSINLPPTNEPYIKLTECVEETIVDVKSHHQSCCVQPFEASKVARYTVEDHTIIAQGDDVKTVYDLTLTTQTPVNHCFYPGDTVGILTKNFEEDVNYIIEHLALESTCYQVYRIEIDPKSKKKVAKLPPHVPGVIQIRKLFTECLDLKAIPKKLFIRALMNHTSDETEKQFISILCNRDGSSFDDIVLKPRLGFLDILRNLPSCKPPVSLLIEHLPRLMPRPYSIANCHNDLKDNPKVRIIFSLNEGSPGLTTSFLKSCCDTGDPIFLYFRKSNNFAYKHDDLDKDVLLIGVGTGIAPYLAFLDHRKQSTEQSHKSTGKALLFAGFRYEQINYLCREEITQYVKENILDKLLVAFSRDPDSQYRYVQNQIEANKEEFVKMLASSHGKLYVCGDGKSLLPQIESKVVEVMSEVLCISNEESKLLVKEYKRNSKYVEDVWL